MGFPIDAVWYAGIALKGAAACRMARSGLARRIPPLSVYLMVCVVRSVILACLKSQPGPYLAAYSATLPFSLLSACAAIIAVFWVIATNYRNFRVFGSILLSGFAIAGVVAASVTCFVVFPAGVNSLRDGMLLLQSYASIVMTVVLAGTRLTLPKSPRIPIPISARRAADILVLDCALGAFTSWIARTYAYSDPLLTHLAPTVSGLLLGTLWLLASGRVVEAPVARRSVEELDLENRQSELAMHRAAAEVCEAARLLHRQ